MTVDTEYVEVLEGAAATLEDVNAQLEAFLDGLREIESRLKARAAEREAERATS